MQPKLIIDYSKDSHAAFVARTLGMVNSLTGNINFPTPYLAGYPSLADLTAAQTTYSQLVATVKDGDKTKIAARDAARAVLAQIVTDLAAYLEKVANKDISKLVTTGYALRKASTHSAGPGAMTGPQNLRLEHGGAGLVIARAKAPKGAGAHETWICTGDPSVEANWSLKTSTKGCARVVLSGLTPGQLYYVRMRGIGPGGPGEWSNVESIRAM